MQILSYFYEQQTYRYNISAMNFCISLQNRLNGNERNCRCKFIKISFFFSTRLYTCDSRYLLETRSGFEHRLINQIFVFFFSLIKIFENFFILIKFAKIYFNSISLWFFNSIKKKKKIDERPYFNFTITLSLQVLKAMIFSVLKMRCNGVADHQENLKLFAGHFSRWEFCLRKRKSAKISKLSDFRLLLFTCDNR